MKEKKKLTPLSEREQIEAVFSLGGGELERTTLTWLVPLDSKTHRPVYRDGVWKYPADAAHQLRIYNNHWWYSGAPEYVEREANYAPAPRCPTCPPEDGCTGYWEYRTLIRDELWGRLEDNELPPGWAVWNRFTTAGEVQHPDYEYEEGQHDEDDPERYVYIGDGWAEVVIRRAITCANEDAADGFEQKPHGPEQV